VALVGDESGRAPMVNFEPSVTSDDWNHFTNLF
jgi:hypothetical protein